MCSSFVWTRLNRKKSVHRIVSKCSKQERALSYKAGVGRASEKCLTMQNSAATKSKLILTWHAGIHVARECVLFAAGPPDTAPRLKAGQSRPTAYATRASSFDKNRTGRSEKALSKDERRGKHELKCGNCCKFKAYSFLPPAWLNTRSMVNSSTVW